jgi:putative transposase
MHVIAEITPRREHTMTQKQSTAPSTNWKALLSDDADLMRELVRHVMQEILEAEMTDTLGAEPGERTDTRQGYRAGYYPRTLVTRVGKLELRVPRDRDGRFSTELFERYQRSEKALVSALAEMYVQGGLDAQGEGHHRGTLRPQLLRVCHQRHQQDAGCDPP